MPKETISATTEPYNVKVGWNPDRNVQVGVEGTDGRSLNWLFYGGGVERVGAAMHEWFVTRPPASGDDDYAHDTEYHEALGKAVLNALDVLGEQYKGVWSDLDRQGCNQLIRVLRRARNAAFGGDE